MKIAVIGAGVAGLASAKYSVEEGFEVVVFEVTGKVGGTWVYTDNVGVDENGLPVHSAMYKGLVTNLPKEAMKFVDFEYPKKVESFLSSEEVADYLDSYAKHFDLLKHIQFFKYVTSVEPISGTSKWLITVLDSGTKESCSDTFDAVMVCNGHYSVPFVPPIKGAENFKGKRWHSYYYRSSECVFGKRILVIGSGYSAWDITIQMESTAKQVFLSSKYPPGKTIPESVIMKPETIEVFENGAKFKDSTTEYFDEIIYCTGYFISFPFLSEKCGITVADNWVQPLYKHIININHPTMAFMLLLYRITPIPVSEVQAKFFLSYLKGNFSLPSEKEMLDELEERKNYLAKEGLPIKCAHKIASPADQEKYCNDLANIAKIKKMPPVINKIYNYCKDCVVRGGVNFEIIDDENFIILS